jgi:hypothetical protein
MLVYTSTRHYGTTQKYKDVVLFNYTGQMGTVVRSSKRAEDRDCGKELKQEKREK